LLTSGNDEKFTIEDLIDDFVTFLAAGILQDRLS
jgi:hypothetical protein